MAGEDRPRQIGSWPDTNLFVVTWKRKKPWAWQTTRDGGEESVLLR